MTALTALLGMKWTFMAAFYVLCGYALHLVVPHLAPYIAGTFVASFISGVLIQSRVHAIKEKMQKDAERSIIRKQQKDMVVN